MKSLSYILSLLAACLPACSAPVPREMPDEEGGTVAILIDRTFGTWKDNFSKPEGAFVGSPPREHRPSIPEDRRYSIELGFKDGRKVKVDQTFASGTSIPEVALSLAKEFESNGLETSIVPEFGAIRLGFLIGLNSIRATATDGFTIHDYLGKRSDLISNGVLLQDEKVARG